MVCEIFCQLFVLLNSIGILHVTFSFVREHCSLVCFTGLTLVLKINEAEIDNIESAKFDLIWLCT